MRCPNCGKHILTLGDEQDDHQICTRCGYQEDGSVSRRDKLEELYQAVKTFYGSELHKLMDFEVVHAGQNIRRLLEELEVV